MARDKELLTERNKRIHNKFERFCKQYPHWKIDYIIDRIADDFCLRARTIENILKMNIETEKDEKKQV